MKKIKIIIPTLICLFLSISLYSTYHRKIPVDLKQPDGTIIIAYATGFDPGYIRYHDENDYTIIKDENTNEWCWATSGLDGWLESTGYAINLYDPKTLGLKPDDNNSRDKKQLDMQRKLIEQK